MRANFNDISILEISDLAGDLQEGRRVRR
jgi:hypothetical protein